MSPETSRVVIVGAGPVGLMLSCELALAGVRPLVLERLPERATTSKANGVMGQVVRLLDHRGLYARLGGQGPAPQPFSEFFFGAMPLQLSLLEKNPLFGVMVSQPELERVLAERAAELGVEVQRGVEVGSFLQRDDGVTLRVKTGEGERELCAAYLVACDGGHSATRKQLGIGFPGISTDNLVNRGVQVSAESWGRVMDLARRVLPIAPEARMAYQRTERGCFVAAAPQRDRAMLNTLEWESSPGDTYGEWPGAGRPMTLGEMRESLERVLGVEVPPLEPPPDSKPALLRRLIGRNTRLAERYRVERVFLAGDAAHVHAATGGPGLNLGLQDAANLAWKLAATLHGWAPPALLDSYERERRAAGARVFMQTQAQTALMAPGGDVTALRQLFGELLQRQENVQHVADLMAGADVRYGPGVATAHAWAGYFALDLEVKTQAGTRRLAELMREARPLLIDWSKGPLREVARAWRDRVTVVAADGDGALAKAVLVRPDGYVAWAAEQREPEELACDGLRLALTTWFGEPVGP